MSIIDVLRQEHRALKKAVGRNRQAWRKSHSELVLSVYEAWECWDAQKADGVPIRERLVGLEKTIRACWPFTRAWKYLCQECDDTGLIMLECSGDATCGRHKEHLPHGYGKPCFCSLGSRFTPPSKPSPEDFRQAGKSKPKARAFTGFGRA